VLSGEVLLPGDGDAAGHAPVDAAKKLVQSGVSGVILVPHHVEGMVGKWNNSMLNVFRDAKIPVVLLDRDFLEAPHRSQYDLVSLDNSRAGFELGCHLLERGRNRFVYIGDPHAYSSSYGRLAGLRKALALQELSLPDSDVLAGTEQSYAIVIERIRAGEIDTVVCNSDHDAALLMRDCQSEGLSIPDDLAVAGFDDQPIARLLSVPLTTVAQPVEALAICAITTLRDRLEFPDLPARTLRIQGELIVRDST
jgi:LacI family transcriptional regulator